MQHLVRRLWRQLGSHRLAQWLIGALMVSVILGGSLPQRPRLSRDEQAGWETEWSVMSELLDGLRLSDIYDAWWFHGLCLLLLINLLAGTLRSMQQRLALLRGQAKPATADTVGDSPRHPATLHSVLGLWGVPIAHLGMLLIVAGAYLSHFTGFAAHLEISEGEVFSGAPQKLTLDRGHYTPASFEASLRLDKVRVSLVEGRLLQELFLDLSYQATGQPAQRASLVTNAPLSLSGYQFYPDNRFGYSALCERRLASGEKRLLLVNFAIPRGDWGKAWRVDNRGRLPGSDNPAYYRMTLQSGEPPVLDLEVSQGPEQRYQGRLKAGESARIGDEQLVFLGMRPWAGLFMAADAGKGWVFAGILLTLGGFLASLLFPFRGDDKPGDAHGEAPHPDPAAAGPRLGDRAGTDHG